MSIDINRLWREVEENPKKFYNNFNDQKKKILGTSELGAMHIQNQDQISPDELNIEDQEVLDENSLNKFDKLISKVSKDIDKKSVYSKKMQS